MPKLSHKEKFQTAFNKIIAKEYDESVGKAQFTKIVKAWQKEEINIAAIKRAINEIILIELPEFATWIHERYVHISGYYWLDSSYQNTETLCLMVL
ncbi:MAG: hypothetical protein HC942_23085 [Microcoleus sp. SU_5_6]|nr:hypothetical protein [Microcoleus sp. SU_5_6]